MSDSPAVLVEGLAKAYGPVKALDGIDFAVPAGTVLGLLGPNGAGKTTAVRILTTLLAPDAGRAVVAGHDVVAEPDAVRQIIGLAGQFAAVDEYLTGRENLELVGRLYHLGKAEAGRRAADVLERFDLVAAADRRVRTYSGGMRRRLDLGASLIGEPQVLFLDEPTASLDPRSRIGLWEVIERLVADGTTLVLTTQYLEEADRLADRVAVVDNGRVIAEGTPDDLKSRVGGEVLEVTVTPAADAVAAAAVLSSIACGEVHVDHAAGMVSVPVVGGGPLVAEAVRLLDGAGIRIGDLAFRRPTLDDVFLRLTGHAAEMVEQ
ncbi:MAG: type transport system ATP-binding protein [Actinomycetota bacterium]|jgi:ABC-2 type transport system ATP-binding protein|nr:type transport system ATP-binding protein [Actinomycetota bacterium]